MVNNLCFSIITGFTGYGILYFHFNGLCKCYAVMQSLLVGVHVFSVLIERRSKTKIRSRSQKPRFRQTQKPICTIRTTRLILATSARLRCAIYLYNCEMQCILDWSTLWSPPRSMSNMWTWRAYFWCDAPRFNQVPLRRVRASKWQRGSYRIKAPNNQSRIDIGNECLLDIR